MMDTAEKAAPVATLLENHRVFLRYLERRVGDRALAEDILQDAFAKVVARPDQAPDDEAIVPWFYRTLRNAAIDQFRRRGAAERAHEAFARELETHEIPTADMEAEICACVDAAARRRFHVAVLNSILARGHFLGARDVLRIVNQHRCLEVAGPEHGCDVRKMRPTRFEVLAVCSILDADVDGTPVREQQEMMSGLLLIEAHDHCAPLVHRSVMILASVQGHGEC
jgi:RNA polymerase sigma factor (sigma-70 family)